MKLFFYKNESKWTNLSAEVCVRVSFSFFKEFFLQILSCSASKYLLARQYILLYTTKNFNVRKHSSIYIFFPIWYDRGQSPHKPDSQP